MINFSFYTHSKSHLNAHIKSDLKILLDAQDLNLIRSWHAVFTRYWRTCEMRF
jgi:hypothetical protein